MEDYFTFEESEITEEPRSLAEFARDDYELVAEVLANDDSEVI